MTLNNFDIDVELMCLFAIAILIALLIVALIARRKKSKHCIVRIDQDHSDTRRAQAEEKRTRRAVRQAELELEEKRKAAEREISAANADVQFQEFCRQLKTAAAGKLHDVECGTARNDKAKDLFPQDVNIALDDPDKLKKRCLLQKLGYWGSSEAVTIEDAIQNERSMMLPSSNQGKDISGQGFFSAMFSAMSEGAHGGRISYDSNEYHKNPQRYSLQVDKQGRRVCTVKDDAFEIAVCAAVSSYCFDAGFRSSASADFVLMRGESLLGRVNDVKLYETRAVRTSHTSGRVITCPLGGGWRGGAYESYTRSWSHDELTLIATGTLYTTTRQFIFIGEGQTRSVRFSDIVRMRSNWRPLPTGVIAIASSKRKKEIQLEGCGLFYATLFFWMNMDDDLKQMFDDAKREYEQLDARSIYPKDGALDKLRSHLLSLSRSCS